MDNAAPKAPPTIPPTIPPKIPFEDHIQWTSVKDVTDRLKATGHQAFLAGGCVRDLLMNREPNDFDIATSATPDEVEALFPNSVAVGKAFGVIILPYPHYQLEVATFREDLEYKDGRRPEGVKFSTPEADAKRRDFTVNALFYDLEQKRIVDFVGGETDIKKKLIQTVGDPDQRFHEDKLRLLRAVRFAGQLDFEIEAKTLAVIKRRAADVSSVSRERVRDEIQKLLKAPARDRSLRLLASTGLLAVLFPKLATAIGANGNNLELWLSRLALQEGRGADLSLALFLFPALEEFGNDKEARVWLQTTLKLESRLIDALLLAVRSVPKLLELEKVRRGELVLLLSKSRILEPLTQIIAKSRGLEINQTQLIEIRTKILDPEGKPPKPFVAGADVLNLGLAPGSRVGQIVAEAYLLQLEEKLKSRDDALAWCRAQIS